MLPLLFCALLSFLPLANIAIDSSTPMHELRILDKKSISHFHRHQFTVPERLLRLCYFRLAVSQEDYLERLVSFFCDTFHIVSWHTQLFNPEIIEKTLDVCKLMGAQEHYVITQDKRGIIHLLTLRAKELQQRILVRGGSWERVVSDNHTFFAIFPPEKSDTEWEKFEKECLSKIGWPKRQLLTSSGESREAFITCEHADLIEESACFQNCFLYCHPNTHSFIGDRARAGFYLGMQQDICFFDHRGVGNSKGIPSEAAFYLDIEAVYEQLMKTHPYPTKNLWIGGFCAGAPIAAHLKSVMHGQGVNFFAEQSFSDLKRDFINTRNPLIRWMGNHSLGGLKSPDIPMDLPGRPAEHQFSIERMWENLPYAEEGKVIIIHTLNDQVLPDAVRETFVQVARRANQRVTPIFYSSKKLEDAHSDSFFFYPEVQRIFIQAMFQ